MSEFVEECRREWRRLRVPDPVANEMAADLAADLAEAEADGASPEQVLGSGAFDPRSFARSWASARGVITPPPVAVVRPLRFHGALVRSGIVAGVLIATMLVGLALFSVRSGSASTSVAVASPVPRQPSPSGVNVPPFEIHPDQPARLLPAFGLLFLLVGVVGMIVWAVYWSPWAHPSRSVRRRSSIDEDLGRPGF